MSTFGQDWGAFPTLYQRLVRARDNGAGIVLTAEEVADICRCPDIDRRAKIDDELQERAEAALREL